MRSLLTSVVAVLLLVSVGVADPATDLRSRDPETRKKAAASLKDLGEKADVAALCRALAVEKDRDVQAAMLASLEELTPKLYPHIATLILSRTPGEVRTAVKKIQGLKEVGKPAVGMLVVLGGSFVPERNDRQSHNNLLCLQQIIEAVNELNHLEPGYVDLLIKASRARQAGVVELTNYHIITFSLWYPGRFASTAESARAVAHLTELLDSKDEEWVTDAIGSLRMIGPKAKSALPKLKALKLSPSRPTREAATAAVKALEDKGD